MPPVQLQTYAIDYTLATQARSGTSHNATPPALEIAAAAFNDDGQMLNGLVENSAPPNSQAAGTTNHAGIYRVEQQIEVPLTAISIRIAVRDTSTDRSGAMEIPLPLAPEPATLSSPSARSAETLNSTKPN